MTTQETLMSAEKDFKKVKTEVKLTIDQIQALIGLTIRNEAKPVIQSSIGIDKCPVCNHYLAAKGCFCDQCGQRLDRKVVAL